MSVTTPEASTVHTAVLDDPKLTGKPELALALKDGDVPKFCAPGSVKLMVWLAAGVTAFETAEAVPVPAELVAVTVKV
jgi:hypothetical protein